MTKAENTQENGENGDRADEPISIIEKGRTSDVRVSLNEFHGRSYLDIRTHVVVDAMGDRVPTRKGCTLPVGKIPELRAALEKAEAEARDRGLLGGEGGRQDDERDEAA
jgi:hypothetical protein